MKILCIGSLNMDSTIYVDDFPLTGQTIIGKSSMLDVGGKGANQAIAISKAGVEVSMYGKVGNDNYGNELVSSLIKENVNSKVILDDSSITGNAMIIVNNEGQNRIIVVPGSNMDCTYEEAKKAIDETDAQIVIFQLEIPVKVAEKAIKYAHSLGKITILNPAPAKHLDEEIFKYVDYFTPNETEFNFYVKSNSVEIDEIIKNSNQLFQRGLSSLIVTLGDKGALFINKNHTELINTRKVKAIDTVAAGDCFNGYFAASLARGKDAIESIRIANVAASISVTRKGAIASIPTIEEVSEVMRKDY